MKTSLIITLIAVALITITYLCYRCWLNNPEDYYDEYFDDPNPPDDLH